MAALLQLVTHPPAAVEWPLEIDLVDEPHHSTVRLATVVRARAWHIEQLAVPRLGQFVLLVNPASVLTHQSRPSTLDKKSFSIASRPILAWSFSTSFSLCWASTALAPNTSSAHSTKCFFQSWI